MAYVMFATKNVPLDPSYKNPVRFVVNSTSPLSTADTPQEVRDVFMTQYFRNYADSASIYKSYANYNDVNFDYGDGINAVLNFDLSKLLASPQTQYDQILNLALNANYLHVRPTAGAGTNTDRFYFIRSARTLSANVVQFVLELDIFSTFIDINITGGVFLERAHALRFADKDVSNSTDKWFLDSPEAIGADVIDGKYNATIPASSKKEFEVQYVNPAQENATLINQKLNQTEWAYFWFSKNPRLNDNPWQSRLKILAAADLPANFNSFLPTGFFGTDDGTAPQGKGYDYGIYCAVFPMKTIPVARLITPSPYTEVTYAWGIKAYQYLFGEPTLIGITISPFAPFTTYANGGNMYSRFFISPITGELSWDGTGWNGSDAVTGNGEANYWNNIPEGFMTLATPLVGALWCLWTQRYILREQFLDSNSDYDFTTNLSLPMPYLTAAPAYNITRQKNFEPKLFTSPFRKLKLQSIYTQSSEYSITSFDARKVKLTLQDVPNPVQEKIAMTLLPNETDFFADSFYSTYKENNLMLKQINQYTMPTGEEAWKSFWANRGAQAISGLALSAAGIVGGVLTANPLAVVAGITSGVSQAATIVQAGITPTTARATGNDLPAEYAYDNTLRPFVVENTLLPQDENEVYDYFFKKGYQFNKLVPWTRPQNTDVWLHRWTQPQIAPTTTAVPYSGGGVTNELSPQTPFSLPTLPFTYAFTSSTGNWFWQTIGSTAVQLGSTANPLLSASFTTDGFIDNIKEIQVNAYRGSSTSNSLQVLIDEGDGIFRSIATTSLTTTLTTYTFSLTTPVRGRIRISFSQAPSGTALYLGTVKFTTLDNRAYPFNRTRFNYIKANDPEIASRLSSATMTMSVPIRQKIQQVLNDGTTFWNYFGGSSNGTFNTYANFYNSNLFDTINFENLEYFFNYGYNK